MLGIVPTMTHTLPAWSIPDIRNTVPTPAPTPTLSVLTLRSLSTCWGPFCHLSLLCPLENPCVSPRPGPLPGGGQGGWCPPLHLVSPPPA